MDHGRTRMLVLGSLVIMSAGCALATTRGDGPPPSGLSPTEVSYRTEVALGECALVPLPEAGPLAGLGAVLLSNAIAEGVNRIGTALQEAAKAQSWTVRASRNVEVSAKAFGPCVQIVRGWFYTTAGIRAERTASARNWLDKDFINEARYTALWQNSLWLAAPPDFAFEAIFDFSQDREALTLAPRYARLNAPITTRWLRPSRDRHVAVFVAFHEPGQASDADQNAAASIVLGHMDTQVSREYPQQRLVGQNRGPHEASWFTVKLSSTGDVGSAQPRDAMTVTAAVVETQGANEFLGFVAAVFGTSKPAVTEALQTILVPEKAAAAKETEKSSRETAATKLDQKTAGALQKLADCAAGSTDIASSASTARAAMRELNQASRAAGKGMVFAEADINAIQVTGASDSVKAACQTALRKLTNPGSARLAPRSQLTMVFGPARDALEQ